DRASLRSRVDHEDHRRVDQVRDVRGRRELAATYGAVVEAHDAFDDSEVCATRSVGEQVADPLLPDEERIEVAARPTRRERVIAGVDVIRADLERSDAQPGPRERRDQSGGDGGL